MTKIQNEKLNEQYFFTKHKSGLPIYIYPKKGYTSSYAIFGTRYGSINTKFEADGKTIQVPDGIAHYLEHKLFESEDGDAFELFAKTGASANAFTSFDQTCYLFNCTDKFEESLEILLNFVRSPFFTDETVAKEQGIIGQEIGMYDDDPDWKILFNLLESMYYNHPVKADIAGTVESIANITPQALYDCYNAYYNLNNMVLCVAGNVDPEKVIEIADKVLKPQKPVSVKNIFPQEPNNIKQAKIKQSFAVASPMFELGFKESLDSERVSLKEVVCTEVLLQSFASKTSELYDTLLSQNLINTASFEYEYFEGPGYASIIFSGESKDPEKTAEIIKEFTNKLHKSGISKEDFETAVKAIYGKTASAFDNIETIATSIVNSHFTDSGLFDYIEILQNITVKDVNDIIPKKLINEKSSLSVITPLEGEVGNV